MFNYEDDTEANLPKEGDKCVFCGEVHKRERFNNMCELSCKNHPYGNDYSNRSAFTLADILAVIKDDRDLKFDVSIQSDTNPNWRLFCIENITTDQKYKHMTPLSEVIDEYIEE